MVIQNLNPVDYLIYFAWLKFATVDIKKFQTSAINNHSKKESNRYLNNIKPFISIDYRLTFIWTENAFLFAKLKNWVGGWEHFFYKIGIANVSRRFLL